MVFILSQIKNGYDAAHDFAATNIFNTPGRKAAGAVVTAGIAAGGAYCAGTTPVLVSGLNAVYSAATTCFQAASGGFITIPISYSEIVARYPTAVMGSAGIKVVLATGAMCSTAATSAALPVLSAVTLTLTTIYLGYKVVQYLRTPSVPHPHTD